MEEDFQQNLKNINIVRGNDPTPVEEGLKGYGYLLYWLDKVGGLGGN